MDNPEKLTTQDTKRRTTPHAHKHNQRKQDVSPPTNNWGKDKQTIHEPSYKQLEVKTNKQYMSPPKTTNNTIKQDQAAGDYDEQSIVFIWK